MILARLLWNFDINAVEGKGVQWRTQKTYTLWEKEEVWVRLKDLGRGREGKDLATGLAKTFG